MSIGTIRMAGREYVVPGETEFTFGDARAIRLATGMPWAEFWEALTDGDMVAVSGLAYLVMRREEPATTIEDIDEMRLVDFEFNESTEEAEPVPLDEEESSSLERTLVASGSPLSPNGGG